MPRLWPVKKGTYTLTSGFGPRWGAHHSGLDFGAPDGTPFYACAGGTVQHIGAAGRYGQWIVIDHPTSEGGGCTEYGHMWNAFATGLKVGQKVTAGQLIGYVGSNGQSTGPHLHLTVWEYGYGGKRIDPETWLAGASWPGGAAPAVVAPPAPAKGTSMQPSTTYTQLSTIDRGPRDVNTVPLIGIHTYECPRESGEKALRSRAKWQETSATGSYTVLVSADGQSLRANDDNYTPCACLPTGDRLGFHVGFLAYASDSRATWLQHDAQLREGARICADWCRTHGHQVRRLTVAEVAGRKVRGFCGHGDISAAFRESDHHDPGPGFPWDVFLRYVAEALNPTPPRGDAIDMATPEDLRRIVREEVAAVTHDTKRVCVQMGMDADDDGFGRVPGWAQGGNRSFYDLMSTAVSILEAVANKIGLQVKTRTFDTLPAAPKDARNPKLKG